VKNRLRQLRPRWSAWTTAGIYGGALALSSWWLQSQSDAGQDEVIRWASTNLHNLGHHPVQSLIASAFLSEGDLLAWCLLGFLGLGLLGQRVGARAAMALTLAGHTLGTLVSEGIVWWRIDHHLLPANERLISDVGPSFVVVSALIGGLVCGPTLARVACGLSFALLTPSLFNGLTSLDVAAVGHTTAIVVAGFGGLGLRRAKVGERP
jgi:hypothetical protein